MAFLVDLDSSFCCSSCIDCTIFAFISSVSKIAFKYLAKSEGVIMLSDHIFAPRKYQILIPAPWSHWAKILFEKYYLWKMKHGVTYLP
jgi:hypothetical protein